ncbi:MAG: hypothetical protein XD95_0574 [Microgenomates bacterium 39_7]|nr:MAG: hypothetical protein XD95_0574 [Microgenomates bacterium 39_7]
MKKKHLIIVLALYLISTGVSYAASSRFLGNSQVDNSSNNQLDLDRETSLGLLLNIDPSAPRDQECPISGKMYTLVEREAWEKRRPLFVMIENSPDARPQSGLSNADVVFEAIAEGGVTRFGAVFYCDAQRQDVIIAPVRSARTYFLDWASGFNFPMYVHVGGANLPGPTDALGQIRQYGWNLQNDIDQFSVGYPTFVRNNNRIPGKQVATEHTVESSTERLWEVAQKRDWVNTDPEGNEWSDGYTEWTFEDAPFEKGTVTNLSYNFWSGYSQYAVSWEYDAEKDGFVRTMGGEIHLDHNTEKPIVAANIIVIKTVEKGPVNELKHMMYTTIGTGKALLFKHGNVEEINWSKQTRTSQILFTDNRGNPVPLARGLTWISVVGLGNEVTY